MNVPVVRDFMTRNVITVRDDQNIYEALKILLKHKLSGAPVVNSDAELVGMLSEKDCLKMFVRGAFENDHQVGKNVSEYMQKTLVTCGPQDGVFKIADMFFQNSFRRLPVLDEKGKMVGLITRRDVLLSSIEIWKDTPAGLQWSDSKYLSDDIKLMLKERGADRSDVRVDSTVHLHK